MTDLLFYRGDGLEFVGHAANGKFVNTDTQNFTQGWSLIVVVGDQVLFYRSTDGLAAIGHIANGKFVNTDTRNFPPGLFFIVPV